MNVLAVDTKRLPFAVVACLLALMMRQTGLDASTAFDGPPAPVPPAVIVRDAITRRATVRAVRLLAALKVDGRLDEEAYAAVLPIADFVQMEPRAGAPATEKTELWIFFDDERVTSRFGAGRVTPSAWL